VNNGTICNSQLIEHGTQQVAKNTMRGLLANSYVGVTEISDIIKGKKTSII